MPAACHRPPIASFCLPSSAHRLVSRRALAGADVLYDVVGTRVGTNLLREAVSSSCIGRLYNLSREERRNGSAWANGFPVHPPTRARAAAAAAAAATSAGA